MKKKAGAILNITGTTEPTQVNASAVSKAAVAVWSKGLSEKLGQYGITINCLQPGLLDTAQIRRLFPGDARREFAEREIALGDFGEAQDVANMVTFLVSPRARYITGTVAVLRTRVRSSTPSSSSSFLIATLRAGCATCNSAAALVKLLCLTIASKYCNTLMSIVISYAGNKESVFP